MSNKEIPDEKYIIAGKPDKERLARYLNDAKGYNRTMRDFALLCNVEPSTFSRVLTKKISRPLKENVIQAIYINSADEDIDYDRLMRANGMYKESAGDDEFEKFNIRMRNNDISIRNTITNRIEDLGLLCISSSHRISDIFELLGKPYAKSKYGFSVSGRMTYGFKDLDPLVWVFHRFDPFGPENGNYQAERVVREFLVHSYSSLFLADEWEPELLENVKINFVFANEKAYSCIKEALSDRTVNGSMSLILIDPEDPDDKTIVEEFTLKRRDGKSVARFIDIEGRPRNDADDEYGDED